MSFSSLRHLRVAFLASCLGLALGACPSSSSSGTTSTTKSHAGASGTGGRKSGAAGKSGTVADSSGGTGAVGSGGRKGGSAGEPASDSGPSGTAGTAGTAGGAAGDAMAGSGAAPPASTVGRVSVGGYFACAVTSAGSVKCWGDNRNGELGNGTMDNSPVPVEVMGISGATAVAAGEDFVCAIVHGGAQCWGRGIEGQLGDGSKTSSAVPVQVPSLASGVIAISAGQNTACVIKEGGAVQCWGQDQLLEDGSFGTAAVPVPVPGLASGAVALAVGADSSCAIMTGGDVQCWGVNDSNELDNGSKHVNMPVHISALKSAAVSVSMAGDPLQTTVCAVTAMSAVQCWGGFINMQPLKGAAAAVSVGFTSVCALMSTGGLQCWGLNTNGVIGDGSAGDHAQVIFPTAPTGLGNSVAEISVGKFATACAMLSDGSLQCWGNNASGELGNGSTTNSLVPVSVTGF